MAKDKRLAKFEDASSKVIEETIRSIPELAQNYKSIKPFLTKIAKQAFRTAASIDEEGHYKYRDVELGIKSFTQEAVDRIGKEFNLSKESVENVGAVIGSIATLAYKKELKVPPTSIVDEDNFKVKIGGDVNLQENKYEVTGLGKLTDEDFGTYSLEVQSAYDNLLKGFNAKAIIPTGIEGLDFTARASGDSENIDVGFGGQWQVGDNGSIYGEVSPTSEKITVGGSVKFKKGGKVTKKRKKRKTKKYTKGCVVRTAKY